MNEKTKKEGYTDQLNQELLGTLGEKASSEQISAAYEKREVHRDTTYHKRFICGSFFVKRDLYF